MAHNLFEVDYCVLLWDFYLISFSALRFCLMLLLGPAAWQLQLQSTNLATISNSFVSDEGGERLVDRWCLDHNGAFVTKLANWINRFHFVYLLVIKHLCFDFLSSRRANQMNHLHLFRCFLFPFFFIFLFFVSGFHRCFLMLNRCKS